MAISNSTHRASTSKPSSSGRRERRRFASAATSRWRARRRRSGDPPASMRPIPGYSRRGSEGAAAEGAQPAGAGASSRGPASIDAADPRLFAAWLEGRDGASREPVGPMRASGEVTFGNDRVAIERFKAEIDRKAVEGRLVYAAAAGGRPARLEAELKAAALDIDRLAAVGRAALAGTSFDPPGETALAIDIGRATVAGLEAKDAAVKLRLDAGGLVLERVAVSDFGGAAFNLSGRIESPFAGPHGAVTLDADARNLDGVLALLARVVPEAAETARSLAARLVPLKTHATLTLARERGAAGSSKLSIEGTAGGGGLGVG